MKPKFLRRKKDGVIFSYNEFAAAKPGFEPVFDIVGNTAPVAPAAPPKPVEAPAEAMAPASDAAPTVEGTEQTADAPDWLSANRQLSKSRKPVKAVAVS
jgi:hypothetical protein